jgi:hypothetical protein
MERGKDWELTGEGGFLDSVAYSNRELLERGHIGEVD